MKSVKFIPKACTEEPKVMDGYLMLKVPDFDEKLEIEAIRGAQIDQDGNVVAEKMPVIKILRETVKVVKPFFLEVAITKTDGTKIASFQDLSDDSDCHGILIEVATKYISGFKLGNG